MGFLWQRICRVKEFVSSQIRSNCWRFFFLSQEMPSSSSSPPASDNTPILLLHSSPLSSPFLCFPSSLNSAGFSSPSWEEGERRRNRAEKEASLNFLQLPGSCPPPIWNAFDGVLLAKLLTWIMWSRSNFPSSLVCGKSHSFTFCGGYCWPDKFLPSFLHISKCVSFFLFIGPKKKCIHFNVICFF